MIASMWRLSAPSISFCRCHSSSDFDGGRGHDALSGVGGEGVRAGASEGEGVGSEEGELLDGCDDVGSGCDWVDEGVDPGT